MNLIVTGGMVLDPFCGAGTTGVVSIKNGRSFVGVELNPEYISLSKKRMEGAQIKMI
jgi:site-specific DNA-methyltransferase (adenine-specific)